MIVFGGKLLAPKKRDGEDTDNLLSSSQAQKTALKSLSKQEKLLLVELQKTRIEIVKELEKLDPSICNTTENWFEVRQTIDHYENKLLIEGGLENTGARKGATLNAYDSKAGTHRTLTSRGTAGTGTRPFSPSKSLVLGSSTVSSAPPGNTVSRIDLSKVPTKLSGYRTGIDILPVLATSGDTAFEAGLKRQGKFKLPVFKLPAIDTSKFQPSSTGTRKSNTFFSDETIAGTEFGTLSRGMKPSKRYSDKIAFMSALISMHSEMPQNELHRVMWYLNINNLEIDGIVKDLGIQLSLMKQQKRQQMLQDLTEGSSSTADEETAAVQELLDRPVSKSSGFVAAAAVQTVSVFTRARELEVLRVLQLSDDENNSFQFGASRGSPTIQPFNNSNTSSMLNSPSISPTSIQNSGTFSLGDTLRGTFSLGNTLRTTSGGGQQPYAATSSSSSSAFAAGPVGKQLRRFQSLPEGLRHHGGGGGHASSSPVSKGLNGTWAPRGSNNLRPAPLNTDFASMSSTGGFNISPKDFSPSAASSPYMLSPHGGASMLSTMSFGEGSASAAGRGNLRSISKHGGQRKGTGSSNNTGNGNGVLPPSSSNSTYGVTQTLMQAALASSGKHQQQTAKRKFAWQTLAPISSGPGGSGSSSNRPGGPHSESKSASQTLKIELLQSLRSMQQHTEMVKDDILSVQDLVAVGNVKAKKYMFAMAAERMAVALERLVLKEYRRGWTAWLMEMRQEERWHLMTSYTKFQSLRHLAVVLGNLIHDAMRQKLVVWMAFTKREVLRLRKISEHSAAIQIQRVARGYLARRRVEHIREKKKFQALYNATVKLQALFRGKITRWRYLRYRRSQLEGKSARLLQRVFRGYRGRKRVKAIRRARGREKAATTIQSIVRMRQARVRTRALILERSKQKMAIKIQAVARGFLARLSAAEKRLDILKFFAAQLIQARVRGMIARSYLGRRRAEAEEYWAIQRKSVTNIQRVYRGYRGRVKSRLHVMEINRRRKRIATAATKINSGIRMFLGKKLLQRLKKQQLVVWMDQARDWVEMWSDDQATWFYANSTTGESQWEPTKQGYTKADGRLVLANGQTVEDPRNYVIAPEDDENRYPSDMCAECSERLSIRGCNECGDHFCTICYKATHSTGTRRNHTFTLLGPIECSECESLLAERMCITCDESYCDGCWRKLHMRGKRRFHPFYEVWPNGKVGKAMMTIDGVEVEDYDATYSQQRMDSEAATASPSTNWGGTTTGGYTVSTEQQQPVSEWSQAYDDQGYPYWYNTVTGVSQYEDPFQQQVAQGGGDLTSYDQSGYDASTGAYSYDQQQGGGGYG